MHIFGIQDPMHPGRIMNIFQFTYPTFNIQSADYKIVASLFPCQGIFPDHLGTRNDKVCYHHAHNPASKIT